MCAFASHLGQSLSRFSDVVVPYDGGAFSVPVVDSFAQWRDVTGCVGPAERTLVVKSAGSVIIYY